MHVQHFYDHPLSGWLRVNSHYHYFEIIEDNWLNDADTDFEPELEWGIYRYSREAVLDHLRYIRKIRLVGGWHWDYDPHTNIRGAYKVGWQEAYKLTKPKSLNTISCEMIGITQDLRWMTPYDLR